MKEEIQKFIDLVKENPDLPVICLVDSDVVADDSYNSWLAEIGYAKVGEYTTYNERYYDDRDDFKDEYYDRNEEILNERFGYEPRMCFLGTESKYTKEEKEANEAAEAEINKYLDSVADKAFRRAIILWVGTPDNMEGDYKDETEI